MARVPLARLFTPAFMGAGLLFALPAMAHDLNRPIPTKSEYARQATVSLWNADFTKRSSFTAFEPTFMNGGTVASGDIDGDGLTEIVVGAGPGRLPEVSVFHTDGKLIRTFRAYPEWFKGGVRVAMGDVDGDGLADIVTAPGPGIDPQVNFFRGDGTQLRPGGLFAYARSFQGGLHVAVGDLDGDRKAEIVTAPGPGGGPHVRVWNGELKSVADSFAYEASMTDGVTVTIVRTPTGVNIVTGVESWSAPLVRRFSAQGALQKEFYTGATSTRNGVSVAAFDGDGDSVDEIAVSANGGTSAEVQLFDLYGTLSRSGRVMDPEYRGAVSLAAMDVDRNGHPELISIPMAPVVVGPLDRIKSIEVNLAEQRLYAYEHGRVARTFLISSGLSKFPTPVLESTVLKKVYSKDYRWNYGPGNPNNYYLPNVKYNLQVFGPFYIHYAYWHNNFGHRMSHGCMNVGLKDAEWIYNWSEVGMPVMVKNGTDVEVALGKRLVK